MFFPGFYLILLTLAVFMLSLNQLPDHQSRCLMHCFLERHFSSISWSDIIVCTYQTCNCVYVQNVQAPFAKGERRRIETRIGDACWGFLIPTPQSCQNPANISNCTRVCVCVFVFGILCLMLSDPYRGSDLKWALWQFLVVLVLRLVLFGMVRSEFTNCHTAVRSQRPFNLYILWKLMTSAIQIQTEIQIQRQRQRQRQWQRQRQRQRRR